MIVMVIADQRSLLNSNDLSRINEITNSLQTISGVKKVWSITNGPDFRRVKRNGTTTIKFISYFEGVDLNQHVPEAIKNEIRSSNLVLNRLINDKENAALIAIQLDPLDEIDSRRSEIIDEIYSKSSEYLGYENVHLGGLEIANYGLNNLSKKDFTLFTALSFLLIFIIIVIFYRNIIYLLIAILATSVAIWITLSLYGLFGLGLNIFTIVIPSIIITLTTITVLHIFNEYEYRLSKSPKGNSLDIVVRSLESISKPCFYATLTTSIGFLSLMSSSTAILKEFGLFAAVGTLLSFLCSFVFSALLLSQKNNGKGNSSTLVIGKGMVSLSKNLIKHPRHYSAAITIMIIFLIWGMFRINVDIYPMGFLPEKHKVMRDHYFIQENWGEYFQFDMVLETKGARKIHDRSIVAALQDFEKKVIDHPNVVNTFSYLHIADRFAEVLYKKELIQVLDNPFLAPRFIQSFTKIIDMDEDSQALTNPEFTKAKVTFYGPNLGMKEFSESLIDVQKVANECFENTAELKVAGYPSLFVRAMSYAFSSLGKSLLLAIFLITGAMILLLRSLKLAFIAIIPNLFPLLTFFGFLGFAGIDLDLATATIGAIILGIAIDDTIHFLTKYHRERKSGNSMELSIQNTHIHVGSIIAISSVVLFIGFAILMLASIKTVFNFGLLITICVVAALIGDLILLPLILKRVDK
jgi:predicted RND superfamily exporter protein